MKKIGILFGKERSFPNALIEKINSKGIEGIVAEPVKIDKVMQGEPTGYAVILDRISQDIPFYRAYLKNAALTGTAVINNPFWWSADEKRFKEMEEIVLRINEYLGYDFNTVELAVRDGIPYAIDFCNPAPDADINSVGQENFDWVVETSANYAIEKAQANDGKTDSLTWGEYVKRSSAKEPLY